MKKTAFKSRLKEARHTACRQTLRGGIPPDRGAGMDEDAQNMRQTLTFFHERRAKLSGQARILLSKKKPTSKFSTHLHYQKACETDCGALRTCTCNQLLGEGSGLSSLWHSVARSSCIKPRPRVNTHSWSSGAVAPLSP